MSDAASTSPMLPGLTRSQVGRWLSTPGRAQLVTLTTAIGWVLDQATKALAVEALGSGRMVPLPGPLYLELTFNEGAAFSLPLPWWVFPIVTLLVVVLVARALRSAAGVVEPLAYGLLLAGALGNLTDRLVRPHPDGPGRGSVADFLASDFWPTFNLADVAITIGFVLLVLAALRGSGDRSERAGRPAAAPAGEEEDGVPTEGGRPPPP